MVKVQKLMLRRPCFYNGKHRLTGELVDVMVEDNVSVSAYLFGPVAEVVSCPQCERVFGALATLRMHLKREHGVEAAPPEGIEAKIESVRAERDVVKKQIAGQVTHAAQLGFSAKQLSRGKLTAARVHAAREGKEQEARALNSLSTMNDRLEALEALLTTLDAELLSARKSDPLKVRERKAS